MKLYYLLLPLPVYTFIRQTQILMGTIVVMIVCLLDFQLPVQLMPITTKVVSSNPAHAEVYLIQHQLIKFVSVLRQVGDFLSVLQFSPPIKLTTKILLKVVLNTITTTLYIHQTNIVVDRRLELWTVQTKDYKKGTCCFSAEPTALRSKNKDQ